jgi:hypothetical protein
VRARGGAPEVRVLIAEGTRLHPAGHPQFDPHVVAALASHPASVHEALAAARAALAEVTLAVETPEREAVRGPARVPELSAASSA